MSKRKRAIKHLPNNTVEPSLACAAEGIQTLVSRERRQFISKRKFHIEMPYGVKMLCRSSQHLT